MIRLVGLHDIHTEVNVRFAPMVQTYNIVSGLMSDDCQSYLVAQDILIWLDRDGFLGELESIYPFLVNDPLCTCAREVETKEGFPQFAILSFDNEGIIQPIDDGFIVWLAKKKIIDLKVVFKKVQFLFAQGELVAIAAYGVSIVE